MDGSKPIILIKVPNTKVAISSPKVNLIKDVTENQRSLFQIPTQVITGDPKHLNTATYKPKLIDLRPILKERMSNVIKEDKIVVVPAHKKEPKLIRLPAVEIKTRLLKSPPIQKEERRKVRATSPSIPVLVDIRPQVSEGSPKLLENTPNSTENKENVFIGSLNDPTKKDSKEHPESSRVKDTQQRR